MPLPKSAILVRWGIYYIRPGCTLQGNIGACRLVVNQDVVLRILCYKMTAAELVPKLEL